MTDAPTPEPTPTPTPASAHPELPRAKAAARIVGLYVPLGLVVVQTTLYLLWLPRLPNPMAVHWSGAGVADGFASPMLGLVMFPLTGLVITALFFTTKLQDVQNRLRPGGDVWGPLNRLIPAIVLSAGALIFTLNLLTTTAQLDLANGRDLAPNLAAMVIPYPVAIAAGVLGYFAQPKLRIAYEADADAGEPIELAAAERVVWLGAITATKPYLWAMAGALVVASASFIWIVTLRPVSVVAVAVTGVALVAVLVLTLVSMRFNVRIDERGLEARSFLGWPRVWVPAESITSVEVGEIHPFGEFGGWGWRLSTDGSVGIVMRTGEGLRVGRASGRPLVITLDDAEAAAAALATTMQHARAQRRIEGDHS
ncbi:DUF1648 domain-containing protein [Leucobacter albus]|uniref:DUF1648 domain-containing protein n=1 Tax=Leucobacter albus TaxID=272210 RepID=A0ABW3TP38_9MICO